METDSTHRPVRMHTKRDRLTDRQTERQRFTHTEKHTPTQTYKHRHADTQTHSTHPHMQHARTQSDTRLGT